jgi:hypothetical protein
MIHPEIVQKACMNLHDATAAKGIPFPFVGTSWQEVVLNLLELVEVISRGDCLQQQSWKTNIHLLLWLANIIIHNSSTFHFVT